MDSGLILALLQQTSPPPPEVVEAARGWFQMHFSAGDVTSLGAVIAHYVAIRERLARLEERVEPMWNSWNLRHTHHRGV